MAEPTDISLERVGGRATGRVQGVGFRATTRASAQLHGVTGWVRNEPDGSVAFEAQGTRAALDALERDLRSAFGTKLAGLEQHRLPVEVGEVGFVVRR